MIDYVLGNKEVKDRIGEMKVGYRIESDHQLVEVVIKGREEWRRKEWRGRRV